MEGARTRQPGESTASTENAGLDAILRSVARAPPRPPPPDPANGTRWGADGRYIVERCLGRGGMGTVYVASDTLLGRRVALKVLYARGANEDGEHRARLLREARLAARLEHDRVARVYDVGEHEGSAFVAMEYVRGVTLREWMSERVRVPSEVIRVVIQIAEGLQVLHANGVIHRDLKPENVMLPEQGGVKLLDFGLARNIVVGDSGVQSASLGAHSTAGASVGLFAGTPGYMAPEQCLAEPIDPAADVFALGVVLYELVTGERPFKGLTVSATLLATVHDAPVLTAPEWDLFPAGMRDLTNRMLARKAADRPANGAAALEALLAIESPGLEPRTARARPVRASRVRSVALLISGVSIVGLSLWLVVPRIVRQRAEKRAVAAAPPPGMVFIPAGEITLGRTKQEIDKQCDDMGTKCDRERLSRQLPSRQVTVRPFFLDAHEVTNAQLVAILNELRGSLYVVEDEDDHTRRYVRFNKGLGHDGELLLDLNPVASGIEYKGPSVENSYRFRAGREDWPATQVSWFGARVFCGARGKRLPTEDEWETAARGASNRAFPWGDAKVRCGGVVVPADGLVPMEDGCEVTSGPRAVAEAQQDVTPEGVRDLGGNVTEWVDAAYDEVGSDPSASLEALRVVRGGSYFKSLMARTSVRLAQPPNNVAPNGGFRCARSLLSDSTK
jgi:serine/threonine protein kinase